METSPTMTAEQPSTKRPRSPSGDIALPAAKVARTHGSHLQINYLSKQLSENLPLVSPEDALPNILRLIGEYDGVLHRHESIASNLGACPLGPILLKRFERLFDGPPRILKHHGKDVNITWLDVVEFARNKPEQFNLEKMRNGVRVCQFYTKQSRVEISEEDYVLIASGMPQKLIPPQPIVEDEEKELGVIDLLEKNLSQVVQLADQVSARARQLNHRLKNRRSAILNRRELENEPARVDRRSHSPAEEINGAVSQPGTSIEASLSPPSGFMAVNMRQAAPLEDNRATWSAADSSSSAPHALFPGANTDNVTIINGRSIKGASPTMRAELMKQFFEQQDKPKEDHRRQSATSNRPPSISIPPTRSKPRSSSIEMIGMNYVKNSPTAVAIPNTPASLLPQIKPSMAERDDGGPFKLEMVGRMESMLRGERILPPCDRCRRLHMDCLKNLTACMGCTKKHAKCSWKDVRVEELQAGRVSADRDSETGGSPVTTNNVPAEVSVVTAAEETPSHLGTLGIEVSQPTRTLTKETLDVETKSLPQDLAAETPKTEPPTPKFDVRPPPIGTQQREGSNGRQQGQYSPYAFYTHVRESVEDDDPDEGDRLQALAAQVYRSASQSVRPHEG